MWIFLGTTFYTSHLYKKAPGTASSLFAFLILYFFKPLNTTSFLVLSVILIICHFIAFPLFQKIYNNDDPSIYTLDESIAILILSWLISSDQMWLVAFFLFRFFDIVKPFGIKNFERLTQISAVIRNIGDDIIAALYTYLLIILYNYVF